MAEKEEEEEEDMAEEVPDRGVSSLQRHWPGPADRGSKSNGTSMHSCVGFV